MIVILQQLKFYKCTCISSFMDLAAVRMYINKLLAIA